MTETRAFLNAMSATVTGVSIVTTRAGGRPAGQTVNVLSSVSDEPPLLLIAVEAPLAAAIEERGAFAVDALADHQAAIAEEFRREVPSFSDRDWWPLSGGGLPRLHGAAARFECRVEKVHVVGTRTIIVGAVTLAVRGGTRPLAYTRRGYAAPLAA